MPAGDKAATLVVPNDHLSFALTTLYNSLSFDFVVRMRTAGLSVDYHVLEQNPLFERHEALVFSRTASRFMQGMCLTAQCLAPMQTTFLGTSPYATQTSTWAVTISERVRIRAIMDAAVAVMFGLNYSDLQRILESCDAPSTDITATRQLNPKGFWRLDRQLDPELRHTVLALVAFRDLESRIQELSGNRDDGIRDFFGQNRSEGWLLPETVCLADHGLGHDDRARYHQLVARQLGPRFYDWQLAQGAEESLRVCHLHARNLLGRVEYVRLLDRLIKQRVRSGDQHHDLLFGQFTRDLVGGDTELSTPTDGTALGDERALRAAEPKPDYSADPSGKRPQTEMFRGPQSELFE